MIDIWCWILILLHTVNQVYAFFFLLTQKIFADLCELDHKGLSYILEAASLTQLFNCMAKLMAHPLQRPLQKDADYHLAPALPADEEDTWNISDLSFKMNYTLMIQWMILLVYWYHPWYQDSQRLYLQVLYISEHFVLEKWSLDVGGQYTKFYLLFTSQVLIGNVAS